MKIKAKTGYRIVIWAFAAVTVISWIWLIYSIVSFIFKMI